MNIVSVPFVETVMLIKSKPRNCRFIHRGKAFRADKSPFIPLLRIHKRITLIQSGLHLTICCISHTGECSCWVGTISNVTKDSRDRYFDGINLWHFSLLDSSIASPVSNCNIVADGKRSSVNSSEWKKRWRSCRSFEGSTSSPSCTSPGQQDYP